MTNAQVFEITIKSDHDSVPRVSAELISNFLIYNYGEKQYRHTITERQEWHHDIGLYHIVPIVTIKGNCLMFAKLIYKKLLNLYPDWEVQLECKNNL